MAVIRCPNCGKPNPDFLEVCQYCDAQLHIAGVADTPMGPSASAEDTLIRPPAPRTPPPAAPEPEDEPADAAPLGYLDRLRRIQSGEDVPPAAKAAADEPDWMWTGKLTEKPTPASAPAAPAAPEPDLPEWLRDLDEPVDLATNKTPTAPRPAAPPLAAPTTPAGPSPTLAPSVSAGVTNYQVPPATPAVTQPPAAPLAAEPSPFEPTASDVTIPPRPRRKMTDWLNKLQELPPPTAPAEPEPPTIPNTDADLPDWLKSIAAQAETPGSAGSAIDAATRPPGTPSPLSAAPTPDADMPDWLRALRDKSSAPPTPVPGAGALHTGSLTTRRNQELPDTLRASAAAEETLVPRPSARAMDPAADDMPDWLRGILKAQDPAPGESSHTDAPAPLTGPAADAARKPGGIRPIGGATPPASAPSAASAPKPAAAAPAWPSATAQQPPSAAASTPAPAAPSVSAGITNSQQQPAAPASGLPVTPPQAVPPAAPIDQTLPPPTRRGKRLTDWLGNVPQPAADTPPAEVLPDWLKTLSAQSAAKEAQARQQAAPAEPVPDWLQATPAAPAPAAATPAPVEPAPAPSVSTGAANYTLPAAPAAAAPHTPAPLPAAQLPDWIKAMAPQADAPVDLAAGAPPELDLAPAELPDWMKELASSAPSAAMPAVTPAAAAPVTNYHPLPSSPSSGLPIAPAAAATPAADLPDWLKDMAPSAPAPTPQDLAPAELPDWMKELAPSADVPATTVPVAPAAQDLAPATLPDWMKELAPSADVPATTVPVAPTPQDLAPATLPDWMKELAPSAEVPATPVPAAPAAQDLAPATLPDWMKELAPSAEVPAAPVPVAPAPQDIAPAELPDWMKELAPSAEAPAAPVPALPAAQDLAPADLPDWMKELAPNAEVPAAPSAEVPPMPPMPVEPAVTPAAAAPVANYDASITAVPAADELPDWLKALTQDEANAAPSADVPAAPAVTPVANYDHVPPASGSVLPMTAAAAADELPDWLKALTQDQPDAAPSAEVPPALVEPAVTPAPGAPVTNFDHVPPASASGLPVTAPAPADELPDWLKDMASDAPVEPAVSSEPVAPITNYDYLPSAPASGFPVTEPAAADELPDWLRAITQSSDAAAAAATTDEPAVETPALAFDAAADAYADAAPDAPASTEPEAAAPITDDEHVPPAPASGLPITPRPTVTLPPWLVGEGTAPFTNEDLPELDDETLAWLSESKKPEPSGLDLAGATLPAEKPAWMDELAAATPAAATLARAAADQSEIAPTPVEEMPDWLRSMRGQAAEETLTTEDTPDWLRTLRGLPPTGQPTPSTTAQPGAAVPAAGKPSPALVPEPVTNYKLPTPAPSVSAGVTETPAAPMPSDLEQVALPAWLSAMRPVEIEQPAEAAEADTYQETLGVLAGMRGVLRAEPAVALPHRAAAPAPALTVSETNTAQANILSELLRSEAVAQPARRGRVRWRALVERWLVFLVLLAAIVLAQFQVQLGLPAIFTTPAPTLPPESAAVYQLIEQLPKDKPALVAFDYDASQSGELDPGAAVVVRQLATRGVPVVAVSLRLTGSGAAEQVLSHSAASGYVNLGYISGGPVGLLQFAVDPRTAFVSDFGGNAKVWQTLPLATVHSLADFGLIVLVSGSPESTRAWLEQAQPYAGDTKTVAVISAGAEPMVRPYYDDPNANSIIGGHLPLKGLIVGLGGAAAYERATYAPAAATALWPALGGGLLAAAVIILLGNLVVLLAAALPRRRKA